MDDRVITDVMSNIIVPQGIYPENFVLISQLEVCQEGEVERGDTLLTLSVPARRHGRQGHS